MFNQPTLRGGTHLKVSRIYDLCPYLYYFRTYVKVTLGMIRGKVILGKDVLNQGTCILALDYQIQSIMQVHTHGHLFSG